jgi:hypothetical protein
LSPRQTPEPAADRVVPGVVTLPAVLMSKGCSAGECAGKVGMPKTAEGWISITMAPEQSQLQANRSSRHG